MAVNFSDVSALIANAHFSKMAKIVLYDPQFKWQNVTNAFLNIFKTCSNDYINSARHTDTVILKGFY